MNNLCSLHQRVPHIQADYVSISPCESLADTVVNGIPLKRIIISTINNIKAGQLNNNQSSSKMEKKSIFP
jgi:hypothetical protein